MRPRSRAVSAVELLFPLEVFDFRFVHLKATFGCRAVRLVEAHSEQLATNYETALQKLGPIVRQARLPQAIAHQWLFVIRDFESCHQ